MKSVIGMTIIFGGIVMFVCNSVPRLMSDLWHAGEFIPARNFTITSYKCTNWNLFMFNSCTITFVSQQSRESRQITDYRFGRAPRDPVRLMQWRDDASSVTTDVSLRTLWNRWLQAVTLVLFGAFLMITLFIKAFKPDGAPIGAPSREPKLQPTGRFRTDDAPIGASSGQPALAPTGRSTFGKRNA
ncbi:MAG: hypothetical protein ABSG76_16970 [Xanthobacteraceae bacterium]|jgi:hypothetical protein